MKRNLNIFLLTTLSIMAVLSLSGCKSQNKALTPVTLCLDWTPNTNHTGFYVAKQKGYFEKEGLDVTIVQPPEDGAQLLCAAGQADFAVGAQDTAASLFASDTPASITAVAALLQHNTSGIMSRAGEGMNQPAGLTGKTYSTWDSPVELAMMKHVVEKDGGDFSKVNLIPNVITDEPGALAEKQTDAIWVFYGWGKITADVKNVPVDYFNFSDIDPVFDYYTPVLFANNDFLKQNPDTAKAFLRACKKGYSDAIANPAEAAGILMEGDNTGSLKDSKELVTKSQEWISTQYLADAKSWGVIDSKRWDSFYDWLYQNKLITQKIPAGYGFTNEYLPE